MAEISGENGAVYYNEELTSDAIVNSIAYSTAGDAYSITSSTAGGASSTGVIDFQTVGYVEGMLITLSDSSFSSGAGDNDRTYTISACASGKITVTESLTAGTDTGTPAIKEEEPGIPVLGFFNWNLSYTGDALETTDFDDSTGGRSYIPGMTSWTATAEKHFLTTNNVIDSTGDPWWGTAREIRLFTKYVAVSTASDTSQYWKGDTIVTGFDETVPVDALINQSISFQGDKALTFKVQTDPWSCGIST